MARATGPIAPGPWAVVIGDKTAIVLVELVHDGGMVEFKDAVTGVPRGCAGIHWWLEAGHKVEYDAPLPKAQDPEKWILPERSPYAS